MNANNSTSISRGFKWVTALSTITLSLLAWTASAKDEVPQKGKETSQVIWRHEYADKSADSINMVVGEASGLGRYTAVMYVHTAAPAYDPASHSAIFKFEFKRTLTAANGDKWESTGEGEEIVPLDANFAPLPPPWAFSGTYKQADGSIFHGTFQGFDFGDGNGSGTWAGVALKKK